MNIENSTMASPYMTDYFNKKELVPKFQMPKTKGGCIEKTDKVSEGEVLGIGTIKGPNGNMSYGMAARYAEKSTEDNPIVQVMLRKDNEVEYYNVNIKEVDPSNATELEMFAYCNYVDDKNMGTGGTFGSWQTLKCIDISACVNGYAEDTGFLDDFTSTQKDWAGICRKMMDDYLGAGIFKQFKDCIKLNDIFSKATI